MCSTAEPWLLYRVRDAAVSRRAPRALPQLRPRQPDHLHLPLARPTPGAHRTMPTEGGRHHIDHRPVQGPPLSFEGGGRYSDLSGVTTGRGGDVTHESPFYVATPAAVDQMARLVETIVTLLYTVQWTV
jgi:hypothetical protein